MKLPHESDRRREMRPAVAALVSAALRLGLHVEQRQRTLSTASASVAVESKQAQDVNIRNTKRACVR